MRPKRFQGVRKYSRKMRQSYAKAYNKANYRSRSNLAKDLPKIKRALKKEIKWHDYNVAVDYNSSTNGIGVWTAAHFYPGGGPAMTGNGIAQNATANGRIGQRVFPVSLEGTITCSYDLDEATSHIPGTETWRVVIVVDNQSNKADVAAADVFDTSMAGNDVTFPASKFNLANRKRFKILYDKCFNVNAVMGNGASDETPHIAHKFHLKLGSVIEYDDGTTDGELDTITRGTYHMFIGGQSTGSDDGTKYTHYKVRAATRMRYTD